ncbi:MAG: OmpA family protein [Candidatus Poribacteria bacterium]|nr:OmpA family protein [Candidatus Poribacteria bacterium]
MQKTLSTSKTLTDENPFSLSLGDLMAGLLLIFILVLSFLMLDLMEKEKQDDKIQQVLLKIFTDYAALRQNLHIALEAEFEKDLQQWNALLDRETLSVSFREPTVLFAQGKAEVQLDFKKILDNFFPRYIQILKRPEYVNAIAEIRIEGHTSSEWSEDVNPAEAYIFNMELSQDRTRSVLQYVLQIPAIQDSRDWLQQQLTANGLSSSKLIKHLGGIENSEESRRVEFRVRTNAEKQLEKIKELEDMIGDPQ